MVRVLYGKKGMGKSRRLIEMANATCSNGTESCVFIDKDGDRMYALDRNIRFINASDFMIDGPKMFSGFISGIAAQDFDLKAIYINGFTNIVKHPLVGLEAMFVFLSEFSERTGVALCVSISSEEPIPDFLAPFAI